MRRLPAHRQADETHHRAEAHPPVRLKLLVTREQLPGLGHPQPALRERLLDGQRFPRGKPHRFRTIFAPRNVGGSVQFGRVSGGAIDFDQRRSKRGVKALPIRTFPG